MFFMIKSMNFNAARVSFCWIVYLFIAIFSFAYGIGEEMSAFNFFLKNGA